MGPTSLVIIYLKNKEEENERMRMTGEWMFNNNTNNRRISCLEKKKKKFPEYEEVQVCSINRSDVAEEKSN